MQNYKYAKEAKEKLQFTVNTEIKAVPDIEHPVMKKFMVDNPTLPQISKIEIIKPIEKSVKANIEKQSGKQFTDGKDSFVICMNNSIVTIQADHKCGVLNGLMTFLRLLDENGCFGYECLYDHPFSSFRGIKLLMPSHDEINHFKEFIDTMVFFRHNTVMLEIGGAMEYKRHPEINEGWEEYAQFMSEFSGKSKKIQEETWHWRKNSIHSNNGGASYLTQEEVKDIIAYCAEREVNIIPEVPSTSHCDYLLTRHPELAERPEDPYPDTFCPSNADSYKLLFDVLDEVIEVFNPEIINVGHDEYYSINICDRCRKRLLDNDEIFAEDITKIHDYLAGKGVKTMIWCDKLMNVLTEDGQNQGGALNRVYKGWSVNNDFWSVIRPTWQARNVIPKDIICMNWYWSFEKKYDEELKDFHVIFGNFRGMNMSNYRCRCGKNTAGGMCSNWGATRPVYLQRNRIYISMAYNDVLYWDTSYNDIDDEEFRLCVEQCFKTLYDYNYGAPQNRKDKYIEIIHTTDRFVWHHGFVDGIYTDGDKYHKDYYLGHYVIKYTDGTAFNKEVFLGENIGYYDVEWYGKSVEEGASDGTPGIRNVRLEPKLGEISYSTLPVFIEGKVYYKYLIENPYCDKEIKSISFVLPDDANWTVTRI